MFSRGLKFNIVINLLLILAAAMLLVDLVTIGTARREMIKARLENGQALLIAIGPLLNEARTGTVPEASQITAVLNEASANCITFLDNEGRELYIRGSDCTPVGQLQGEARKALSVGESRSSFTGVTKGVIWPTNKTLLVSQPYFKKGKIVGAFAIALNLEGVYQSLRDSQRIFFVYFLINLLIFGLIGFYLLYRGLFKPINRLVDTAEKFRDDEEFSFLAEKKDGEFNRLSHSLNKMLARIGRDRGKLRGTISELEDANLLLRKTQLDMVRAEKLASVGRLSAGIAHEIGNPIGIVIGYLDLLKQNDISEEQKKDFILRAETEVNRVNTIIRQLLDFARHPSDEQQSEISVHEVIEEVVDICRVQPMMTDIKIVVEDEAEDYLVVGSNSQLKQVILNLLINAADAINGTARHRKDGMINITTANPENGYGVRRGAIIRIRIADNGPGIVGGDIENIFDPFYTTKEPGKGTGLGLSICFTIIENMGGNIEAASSGDGTTITVDLPLAPSTMLAKDKDL